MKGTYRYIPILQLKKIHCYCVEVFCIFDGMKKKNFVQRSHDAINKLRVACHEGHSLTVKMTL